MSLTEIFQLFEIVLLTALIFLTIYLILLVNKAVSLAVHSVFVTKKLVFDISYALNKTVIVIKDVNDSYEKIKAAISKISSTAGVSIKFTKSILNLSNIIKNSVAGDKIGLIKIGGSVLKRYLIK